MNNKLFIMAVSGFIFTSRLFLAVNIVTFLCSLTEDQFCYKPIACNMNTEERSEYIFKEFWLWRLRNSPEFATSIGVHDHDDRLDEMSLNSYIRRKEEAQRFLEQVEELISESSTAEHPKLKLNMDLLKADLNQYLQGLKYRPYLWPLNRLEGPQLDFPRLLSWMKTDTVLDYEKIIIRMQLFSQQIDETLFLLKEGIRTKHVMHRISVEPLPEQLKKMAEQPVTDSPLWKPFKEKPSQIEEPVWSKLTREARNIIETSVYASYRLLSNFIATQYLNNTRPEIGASSLPNGKDYYKACLQFHTTTDYTPQEVHNIGKKEVARITERMEQIKNDVGFKGSLEEFRSYLRTEKKFKFTDAEEIVSHYQNISKMIKAKLPDFFTKLPVAEFTITPVPAEVAPTFPGAYYLAPPQDNSRPGTFYINTYQPGTRNKYEAVSLCLHEAEPGHHLQTALTMESGSLVSFRRFMEDRKYYEPPGRFAMNTAYVEGWGLYSEYLGEEMGLYSDPYDLFGRLSHEMLRACRLVVDTGMHALGWDRDRASNYMLENTAADLHDITSEIDRYITWPGQACGYKIGELKLKASRKRAEEATKDKFNLREFHDLIASIGGMPLDILEKEIETYIKEHL